MKNWEQALGTATQACDPRNTREALGGAFGGQGAAMGIAGGSGARTPISDRIEQTMRDAKAVYERAEAASRAREILNKYPEFGELLDLLARF